MRNMFRRDADLSRLLMRDKIVLLCDTDAMNRVSTDDKKLLGLDEIDVFLFCFFDGETGRIGTDFFLSVIPSTLWYALLAIDVFLQE